MQPLLEPLRAIEQYVETRRDKIPYWEDKLIVLQTELEKLESIENPEDIPSSSTRSAVDIADRTEQIHAKINSITEKIKFFHNYDTGMGSVPEQTLAQISFKTPKF